MSAKGKLIRIPRLRLEVELPQYPRKFARYFGDFAAAGPAVDGQGDMWSGQSWSTVRTGHFVALDQLGSIVRKDFEDSPFFHEILCDDLIDICFQETPSAVAWLWSSVVSSDRGKDPRTNPARSCKYAIRSTFVLPICEGFYLLMAAETAHFTFLEGPASWSPSPLWGQRRLNVEAELAAASNGATTAVLEIFRGAEVNLVR